MNISFSTVIANLKNKNGYGYAAKNIVESLNKLGHNVPFQDPKSPVQLNFSQPSHFKLHKNQYQISYTPWESTVIPEEWKYYMNACDEIWTTSNWCANIFEDNGFKDIKVFPHGIDPMWIPNRRQDDGVIKFLHIGEPAPRKAGQIVVDAFTKLFGGKEGYSLTIKADQINTTRIYNNYIDKNIIGLPNELYPNINLITKILNDEELVQLYQTHDVLIYPSYGEGFGFIPLQALATGMPTICTSGWAHYENYLGPLKLKSELIDSPWPFPHEGKVFEPNYQHLLELMRDVAINFNAYSGYYFAQSTKIHKDYNWDQLTKNAFNHIFKKFS
jgi:glycosyltransferase involved in cell wall biosynthesis